MKKVSHQLILTLLVIISLILFKLIFDKMIQNNKQNDIVETKYEVNNDNNTGLKNCKNEWIFQTDGDAEYDVNDLLKLIFFD